MIIRAEIADFDVGRVPIDTGSSVNIIFAIVFGELGIDDSHVNRQLTPLLSFYGDLVEPIALKSAAFRPPRETLYVQGALNGNGPIDDPRDKAPMPQVQHDEELGTIVLNKDQPEQCAKIDTTPTPALKAEFIEFLRNHSEVFAWSYDDMPGISPDVISHKLSISLMYKPVH
ncbi:hypothetical protein L3X38_041885 [Prunus dulcis]|uniref:Uncharacterized protein n=1 Tax=Prunus dulcis TaxID=3755 RepID=A0AAD4YKP9_PRUDU|nr:hypothetical protein L3X38_041885 [Prunus dulcis]